MIRDPRGPLRLLVLVHGYPPAVGGVEFAMRDLAERLVASYGHEVTVLTTDAYTNENFRDPKLPRIPIRPDEVRHGVRIRRFPVVTRWAPALRFAQALAWRARLPGSGRLRTWYQGPISPGLRRAAAELPADVVLAASFPLNHLHYAFRRPDRTPVVLVGAIHPWDPWGYERSNLLRLTRRAAATVAFTAPERDWLVVRGAPAERVPVIPLGVDPAAPRRPAGSFRKEHGIPPDAYLVAYVGQLGSHKGVDVLLAALPDLLRAVPDAWLAVAGAPTPYSPELRRLADALSPEARRRLVLLEAVDEDVKAALLEDCDVFASPSRHESFGITTLEAWAHGRPVVVGGGPAQRALLEDGKLGLLVPYGEVSPLGDALAELAADPGRRRRLGEAGRARVAERYTLDEVSARYQELLLEISSGVSRMQTDVSHLRDDTRRREGQG